MAEEKTGGYISKIQFNDGNVINIKQNDIVVFVGPNNSGKSQALRDIYSLCESKKQSIVVSNIEILKSKNSLEKILSKISDYIDDGDSKQYEVFGKYYNFSKHSDRIFQDEYSYGYFNSLFVSNLDTATRLQICNPPLNISRNSSRQHPIHYAAFDKNYRKWLSDNFKKAFGIEITPNLQYGAEIPLCMGAPVKFDKEYDDEQSRQEAYAEILDTYKQVQNQGDGIKSFTGILLYLMLDYYCTYLIDEPEAFLHPPQARIMGHVIGQTLSNQQQAFVSTHSEEIIKGLLEACPERIKIVRITRKDDKNYFSILDNNGFSKIWCDPILKYSNIMSSLFHKSVVLCESDSDCKLYSIIEDYIKQSNGKFSETLYIHCGGKQRMYKVVKALRGLNINIKLIVDIDVMNDENVFKNIVSSFGIDWEIVKRYYNIVVSNLHSQKEKINRNGTKININQILDASATENLSTEELSCIRDSISVVSKWEPLKKSGITAIPAGDATDAFVKMNKILKDDDIYIVPVGELECFVKTIGGHGPEWVNRVLETYPDLDDEVYSQIKNFITDMNL